ncbi:hypothetical protein A3762_02035 [Oleiphilus sp. HI0125]|uniref:penicillin-binding protein 1B n=5 Tax=unclassified Oleiphilus TaxID=2631174 RepID=UPI0007C3771E|nr:penicillin-binding protein 1B [Oleiphilus sp. HI0125]KZZ62144.1 hypothetical protein A3762_02035 [Oleiphilus sp. HI0125]
MAKSKQTKKAKAEPSKSKSQATKSRSWLWKVLAVLFVFVFAWLIYLDAQVRYKFEGKRWALPAQVLARPLELFEGQVLNIDNLEQELALLNYAKKAQLSAPGTYKRSANQVQIFRRAHRTIDGSQQALRLSLRIEGDVITSLSTDDAKGQGIYTIEPYKIGGIYPKTREERELIAYENIPPGLVSALLSTEDRDFFTHFGIAPLAIARAMYSNVMAGRVVQGGSTLTQQLVKNFYLTRERSIVRKINEAFMALMLEWHYSKEDILETYVNDIYLGQSGNTAVHGFAMASRFYFARNLENLELEQHALLVGLLKGPSFYDPRRHPKRATKRRNLVLSLMHEQNWISRDAMLKAQSKELGVTKKPSFKSNRYPAFIDLVKRQLREDYDTEDLSSDGLRIYTTLDPQLQQNLESAIAREIKTLDKRKRGTGKLETGAVITAVGTGEVLAIMGGRDPRYQGFNRALDADRAVGSLIKPAIYLAALEQPEQFQLATKITDEPFVLEFENGDTWTPSNFNSETHGEVALVEALANSYNLAAARLGLQLGMDRVRESLRRLGVNEALNPYPSLLLGAQAMTPFDVAKFYQTIASNGFNMPLRAIREVTDHQGNLLSRYHFNVEQVISPEASYLLQSGMQEVMRAGTGRSAYRTLPTQLLTAGKTGTTNDFRDSWFAGFSGDYLGVFWLGNDQNESIGLTGSSGALRLWTRFMSSVPQYPLATPKPSDIDVLWFDQDSWNQTHAECDNAQPLPIWGDAQKFEWQACQKRTGGIKSWLRSWLQ